MRAERGRRVYGLRGAGRRMAHHFANTPYPGKSATEPLRLDGFHSLDRLKSEPYFNVIAVASQPPRSRGGFQKIGH